MPRRYGDSGMHAARGGFYFAPNAGLTYANGIANGVNQGMQNMLKARQMAMQQQYMRARAQALQTQANGIANWRNAIAEKARKDAMDADTSKLDLLASLRKHGGTGADPGVIKKFESQYMDKVLQNMKPEEAKAAAQRINAMADQGQVAPEFGQFQNLNQKETLANNTAMKTETSQANAQARNKSITDAANISAGARVKAANISATAASSRQDDHNDQHDIDAQRRIYQMHSNAIDKLTKPSGGLFGGMGSSASDPAVQSQIEAHKQGMVFSDDQIRAKGGTPLMQRTWGLDEAKDKARPGDFVKLDDGKLHQMLPNGKFTKDPVNVAPPQAPADPGRSPQSMGPATPTPMPQGSQGDNEEDADGPLRPDPNDTSRGMDESNQENFDDLDQ